MKSFSVTSDAPSWSYVSEISDEMRENSKQFAYKHPEIAAEKKPIGVPLRAAFPHLDFDIGICFRCLSNNSGWVSKSRMYKNDETADEEYLRHYAYQVYEVDMQTIPAVSRILGMDIVVYEDDFIPIKKDKPAQKLLLGTELWRFLNICLPKYQKKIPMTDDDLNLMLLIIKDWLIEHNWLVD